MLDKLSSGRVEKREKKLLLEEDGMIILE